MTKTWKLGVSDSTRQEGLLLNFCNYMILIRLAYWKLAKEKQAGERWAGHSHSSAPRYHCFACMNQFLPPFSHHVISLHPRQPCHPCFAPQEHSPTPAPTARATKERQPAANTPSIFPPPLVNLPSSSRISHHASRLSFPLFFVQHNNDNNKNNKQPPYPTKSLFRPQRKTQA